MAAWNPEWLSSRLQKMLTKNIAILYFDLPMSDDPTSLLSAGILSGMEIDQMGGQIVGGDGTWRSFSNPGDPGFTVYDEPGKPVLWRDEYLDHEVAETGAQIFSADLSMGLFVQRKTDFEFDEDYPFRFIRAYTTNDDRSRSFGIGATNSLDMMLVGQMGVNVDLCMEDGGRIQFIHEKRQPGRPDTYRERGGWSGPFTNAAAEFDGKVWSIKTNDGWTYFFPFRAQWLPQYVTVLTSFRDPGGKEYKMDRDQFGALVSITTPSGKWLHLENDGQHRIRRIESSVGRTVRYEYDKGGRLIRVTDSAGNVDAYTYDDKSQMVTAAHKDGAPILVNAFTNDGYIRNQTVADGGKFEFSYFRSSRNITYECQITDPHGLLTSFLLGPGGYTQSLPTSTIR
jgi:YD repeat-containing protein